MAARAKMTIGRLWLVRIGVGLLAGLVIGAGIGVAGVSKLDPARPGSIDSLQLVMDRAEADRDSRDPRTLRRAADSAEAEQRAERRADSIALANDPNAPVVPNVLRLDEGAARDAIEAAGLSVGAVQFRASPDSAGTVLATSPAAGLKVRSGTPVNLVLSDGRTPPSDTTVTPDTLPDSLRTP